MKLRDRFDFIFFGMTLVELLVVMAIMAILVAFSVPALKPMLESQRAANGARVVAMTLQQTRLKAMRENRPCGVEFMRFESEKGVSLQMRTVKDSPNFIRLVVNGYEVRCIVKVTADNNGTADIVLVKKKPTDTVWKELAQDDPTRAIWERRVTNKLQIQFNRQGQWYDVINSYQISGFGTEDLPADNTAAEPEYSDAVEFKVTQRPASMLNSVTVLPRGTVIDLQHSGHEETMQPNNGRDVLFPQRSNHLMRQSVIVMFSPAGYVDRFYTDGNIDSGEKINPDEIITVTHKPFRGVFYFLVGEWDKINGGEDGKNNLETQSNFWVTIKDRDGTVRISPNAEIDDARKHARADLYNNIGGL